MSLTAPAGGECVGITLTVEEKVGSKVLAMRRASRRLNLSDHFWSRTGIFVSVADLFSDFMDLSEPDFASEVEGLSFLGFFPKGSLTLGD